MLWQWLMGIGIFLMAWLGFYYYKHQNDGGGQDGEMGIALMHLFAGGIGAALFILGLIVKSFWH